jgi:hypothetical protein
MVDRYTKIVLTVIAVCLVIVPARGTAIETAIAQSGPVHVIVDSVDQFAFQFTTVPVKVRN